MLKREKTMGSSQSSIPLCIGNNYKRYVLTREKITEKALNSLEFLCMKEEFDRRALFFACSLFLFLFSSSKSPLLFGLHSSPFIKVGDKVARFCIPIEGGQW